MTAVTLIQLPTEFGLTFVNPEEVYCIKPHGNPKEGSFVYLKSGEVVTTCLKSEEVADLVRNLDSPQIKSDDGPKAQTESEVTTPEVADIGSFRTFRISPPLTESGEVEILEIPLNIVNAAIHLIGQGHTGMAADLIHEKSSCGYRDAFGVADILHNAHKN